MTKPAQPIYEFGPFRLDAAKRLLLREGETLQLTPKCFGILPASAEAEEPGRGKQRALSDEPDIHLLRR